VGKAFQPRESKKKKVVVGKEGEEEEEEISLLPGGGPSQQLKTWLRVPGEDDVPWRPKDPVAQHHLQIKGKLGSDVEESLEVGVGCSLVGDHEVVRVEDHQGKEVANEAFSQPWQPSEPVSHCRRIALAFVNKVRAEGSIGLASLKVLLGFVIFFVKDPRCLSLLSGCPVIEVGSLSGVNLPS